MENKRAVAYVRVSTEEQARGGVSLDAQTERLEAYCRLAGLELLAIIREEGVSGAKPLDARAGGKDMLALIRGKKVAHVLSLKLDRLFRDTEDALRQTRAWDKAGIALHLVDLGGQTFCSATAMGRFFLGLLAGVAELERNLISERTATALAHMKRHHRAYGPVAFGWERQGDDLIALAAEQAVIQQMRRWRDSERSFRDIAKALNEQHVPTKGGGRWHASVVNKILRNDLHGSVRLPKAA
jgi:DNA invertase Pin-like site-specific DNA recombinase